MSKVTVFSGRQVLSQSSSSNNCYPGKQQLSLGWLCLPCGHLPAGFPCLCTFTQLVHWISQRFCLWGVLEQNLDMVGVRAENSPALLAMCDLLTLLTGIWLYKWHSLFFYSFFFAFVQECPPRKSMVTQNFRMFPLFS